MGNADVPFIAAIGGLWQIDKAKLTAAQTAARDIGVELAKAGFGLVVFFSDQGSLEPHVVAGYSAAVTDGHGSIRIRYAESQRGKVKFPEETDRPELFEHHLFPGQDWEGPFYRCLAEDEGIDALLLLGGARSTFIAGQIAIARRLPILAVDEFGGSAAKIWNQLAQSSQEQDRYSWGTRPAAVFIERLKSECAAETERRKETRRREQVLAEITGRRQQIAYAAGAFILLLITLFFGMAYTPFTSTYPFVVLLGLISAGATGALARAVLWGPAGNDPQASLLLGSIAGFVVGIAYLIPQWIGAPGMLAPKVDAVSAIDKIQFASAILVALSAGVGFDTVFSRLQKQAQDAAVGPP
jgi:hypothetical protein